MRKFVFLLAGLLGLAVFILFKHSVDKTLTQEDRFYIQRILEDSGASEDDISLLREQRFDAQIALIVLAQKAAFDTTPHDGHIPKNMPREPKNLYETDAAYCSDRARLIEKTLSTMGFETRFASLYSRDGDTGLLQRLLKRGKTQGAAGSHAMVEVLTDKGWLAVDTRRLWISLDDQNKPVPLARLNEKAHQWSSVNAESPHPLLTHPFFIIYGLYSRHGQFYPPYTPYIPDINWHEFMANF